MVSSHILPAALLAILLACFGAAGCEEGSGIPVDVDAGDAGPDASDGGDASPDADAGPVTCSDSSECTDPAAPVCIGETCQPCTAPSQCEDKPGDADLCEGGRCVECTVSATHCTNPGEPICDDGFCRACSTTPATDCSDDYPNEPVCLAGACVECADSVTDCGFTTPICDLNNNTCRVCESHAECDVYATTGTGVCDWDSGECVDPGAVIYVDIALCGGSPDGTSGNPYCQIQDAIDVADTTRDTILVATGIYDPILVNNAGDLRILSRDGADIAASSPHLVQVSHVNTNLIVDGFVIRSAFGAGNFGVFCNNNATLRLIDNTIQLNQAGGVVSSGCDITLIGNTISDNTGEGIYTNAGTAYLEANHISNNRDGGVNIDDTNFTVINNIIVDNGTSSTVYGGVYLDGSPATTVFSSNTVVSNHAIPGVESGVRCVQVFDIVSSVVSGSEFPLVSATCQTTFSYIGDGSGGGTGTSNIDTMLHPDPGLDGNYKLQAGSICIDNGDTSDPPLYDFEGQLRDATPDIGADEF